MITTTLKTEKNLGPLSQIPLGEGREFVVDSSVIAVFHTRHGIYASQAACPHREGPLIDGLIGGTSVVCPLHAWKFDLTTGQPLMGTCGITTYPVRLSENGDILLAWSGRPPAETTCDGPSYPIFTK